MLAEALPVEVDAYLARFAGVHDDASRRLVTRNGSHMPLGQPAPAIRAHGPRVNDPGVDSQTVSGSDSLR